MGQQAAVVDSLGEFFRSAISAALTQYGPGTVLLVLGIIALFILHERLWYNRLEDKNKEIERVAKERNRYQDMILGQRLSSRTPKKDGE